jgi:hypothetical protein
MGTGTKEDESSTGRVWAAGFHHVMARVLKLMNRLIFKIFLGHGKPRITETADIGVRPYCNMKFHTDKERVYF